jgi:RNA polymerase sigma-70 factor (ECF subfamily)
VREPDPDTIRRAQAGDLDAFELLVRACQGDAWRYAYHLTRDRMLADDVTQEAFVRAFRSLRTFRAQSRFTSWLLRIVHNCSVDARLRARRDRILAERAAENVGPQPSHAGAAEDRLRLQEAVDALPRRLRDPFVLIEVLGFDYRETADILRVPVGTLKSRMHRARAALMARLEPEEAADEM